MNRWSKQQFVYSDKPILGIWNVIATEPSRSKENNKVLLCRALKTGIMMRGEEQTFMKIQSKYSMRRTGMRCILKINMNAMFASCTCVNVNGIYLSLSIYLLEAFLAQFFSFLSSSSNLYDFLQSCWGKENFNEFLGACTD